MTRADDRLTPEDLENDPDILNTLVGLVGQCGVVGERHLIKAVLLASTSVLTQNPLNLRVIGASSSGKSYTLSKTLDLIPADWKVVVASISEKGLFFDDTDYRHKLLFVVEADTLRASKKGGAAQALRILISEGKICLKITIWVDGKPVVKTYETEGPIGVLTTATSAYLDPELSTRILTVYTDESTEQTQAVMEARALIAAGGEDDQPMASIASVQEFLRDLPSPPITVRVRDAPIIRRLFCSKQPRSRRDFEHVLSAICGSAIWHWRHRKIDQDGCIFATFDDFVHAFEALGAGLERSADDKHDPAVEKLVNLIRSRSAAPGQVGSEAEPKPPETGTNAANPGCPLSLNDICSALGMPSRSSAQRLVEHAKKHGAVVVRSQTQGSTNIFEIPAGSGSENRIMPTPEQLRAAIEEDKELRSDRQAPAEDAAGEDPSEGSQDPEDQDDQLKLL